MTPTEIHTARTAGCEMIKIFPGDVLGTTFIKGIKPLFPNLKFVVTGGVEPTLENIKSWFDAGVVVVGMGSKLVSKSVIQNKNYNQLRSNTLNILNIIHILKRPHSV
jgi:2-dehydro-3-deoxyphosphogluconate aldolase/(4S)-4-hydroxy-2-oxoglutarate aldolase